MRKSRALLLALTTVAVLVLAPPALGQSPLSVEEESHNSCGDLLVVGHHVEGLCAVHAVSTSNMVLEVSSTPVASCASELGGVIGGDGIGYLNDVILTGGLCSLQACEEEEGEIVPWQVHIEENVSEDPHMLISMCLNAGEEDVPCEFEAEMVVNSHSSIEFMADDAPCAEEPSIEVTGEWAIEGAGEENYELAFRPPPAAAVLYPIGMTRHHDFNGAMAGSEREVTFKNNTGAAIVTTTAVKTGNAGALARYTLGVGCNGQTLQPNDECDVVVTKTNMGNNLPVAIRVHYAAGASMSEPFLFYR